MADIYDSSQEIEALKAIFCGDGEFIELLNKCNGEKLFRIHLKLNENEDKPVSLQISFNVSQNYPNDLPDISFSSTELSRKCLDSLKCDLLEFSKGLRSQPMIMDQVMWLQENVGQYIQSKALVDLPGKSQSIESIGRTVLCQLDHMRSQTKYCKKLTKWALELSIEGGVYFIKQMIFILLSGRQNNVKEFLMRLKTRNVDVDSHGKSCKERMIKILIDCHLTLHMILMVLK